MFKYYLGGSGAPRIPSFCITWTSCILTPILCITFKNFSLQCMAQLFWETKMKKKKRYKKFTLTVQSYISAHLCTFSPHGWEALPNLAYLSMYSQPFSYKGGCWKDIYFLRSAHPMSSFRSFLLNVQEFTTKVEGDLFYLICWNLSVGEVMNAICEAQLCQFVVVLQKVLKLQKKDITFREKQS